MKIDSSAIAMSSDRSYASVEQTKTSLRMINQQQDKALSADMEKTSVQVSESQDFLLSISEDAKEKSKQLQENRLDRLRDKLCGDKMDLSKLREDQEMTLVEQILNAMDEASGKKPRFKSYKRSIQANFTSMSEFSATMESLSVQTRGATSSGSSGTAYYNFAQITTRIESEATSFTAQGVAKTADGREIAFSVDIAMTREFVRQSAYSAQLTKEFRLVDPLVINVDADVASVRNQKFTFDINADGVADQVSQLSSGSGFLALDKNGNGKVDDGSELFGARSGDGFQELAAYDEDGNGWIDEADSVFDDLQVWIRDEDGTDRLVALAKADVGAIYLGSASTDFSLNNAMTNHTNAVIRRSGIYLKESGGVGTVQHVDFAI